VYLVSASPAEIVEPLGTFLGVDEAIASRASVDAEGRYTGEVETYVYGPYKAEAVQAVAERDGIDLAGSWAYSDSVTDIPLLSAVGHPVAVNADRGLARHAREAGWEVRTFRRGVPLRERVAVPGPGRIALGAAALAGVAAGAATGWWVAGRAGPLPEPARRRFGPWERVRRPAAS
jgi:hypothetical protein